MRLLVLLLISWAASGVFAAGVKSNSNERDYIIEVLIFAQQPGAGATEIAGRPHIFLPVEERALRIGTTPAWKKLIRASSPYYRSQQIRLTREAYALKNSNDYRVLFHDAWRMRLVAEPRSVPLLIEGGDYFDGIPELQGKLKLSVARYLHLETDLFFNTFEPASNAPMLKTGTLPDSSNLTEGIYQVKDSSHMHQRRRMRSNELHFIDSPYLGLLIKVDRAP